MIINTKMLSLPPFISVGWGNISALYMKNSVLAITLIEGNTIDIPDLNPEILDNIFKFHAEYLEREGDFEISQMNQFSQISQMPNLPTHFSNQINEILNNSESDANNEPTVRIGFAALDELGSVMQHNPSQSDSPDLPAEILAKIVAITNIVAPDDASEMPNAELNCNCFYCQIARAMSDGSATLTSSSQQNQTIAHQPKEEEITAADLKFREWDISQTGNKMFMVVNPLDSKERYSVYLGQPVGCTCGKQGCEHIVAVLKS